MKLNARLILISFAIVLIISVSSMFVYYSLAGSLISKQQNKAVLNATSDFVFSFESTLQKPEEDFTRFAGLLNDIKKINLDSTSIDFIFTLIGDSLINFNQYSVKKNVFINAQSNSFKDFFKNNPNTILKYKQLDDGKNIFYGKLITSSVLDSLSQNMHAEVALVINDSPIDISNSEQNQVYLLSIVNAERYLKFKNNFDLFVEELDNSDFVASFYTPRQILTPGGKISFIIFESFKESAELKSTLKNVAILIVVAGSALTFIFVLLFTTKLRKQISLLGEAVEITRMGDLDHRVPIIQKDEVGKLGEAFNQMLDEIKKNKIAEQEYSEFIAMINQNPTLKEISNSALNKIIKATGLTFGIFYRVAEKKPTVISTYGVGKDSVMPDRQSDFYNNAIEKHEEVEFEFQENFPEIKTGLAQIKIKYLIVYPIVYNKETIAILELAGESSPKIKIKKYLENIHDQLAIGLNNAHSLEQLENLVEELKNLNEEYHKQNLQIVEQGEKQKELHQRLEEKASELEAQRTKAVELSKAKSQFLASMSHELRTPLISILGLTELMIKDTNTNSKLKERINIVYRNGKKLLGMITNILEFSKFDTGKIDLKKESFLLDELLDDILPGIKLIAGEKRITFELVKKPNVNLVLNTDRTKLEQVLNNLLVNAVKYTEIGKILLKVILHRNKQLEFRVSDTGIGIHEADRDIIFGEFNQLDVNSTKKIGGVGLGLAICKRFVELLDSKLNLESRQGEGSCFSFVLDDCVLDIFEQPEFYESEIENNIATNDDNSNVLLITDNSDIEKLFADYLADNQINISWAPTYEKAVELMKQSVFRFVVINPLKNDSVWSFAAQLRNSYSNKHLDIIIVQIIEEEQTGWIFNIDGLLQKNIKTDPFKNSLTEIEISTRSKISEITFVSSDSNYSQYLKTNLFPEYSLKHFNLLENIYNRIATEIPDALVIDVDTIKKDSFEIFDRIRMNYATQNVPVIFMMPEVISKELNEMLNRGLRLSAQKHGSNILEILKLLASRIKSDSTVIVMGKNIENQTTASIEIPVSTENISISYSKPTILVVDDDSDSLFTIGEIVKELNYETIFAHNGVECLLTLKHVEPDLILLDIMMPQMDGFETIKRIRTEERFEHIPVLALTAYAMLDNKNVIEKNGFNDLITKPVNSKILAAKIKENLKQKVNEI